jgi:hypothetical protein
VLTLCTDLAYLYGTLTTLQTIRTGFPMARVLACDNGSLPEAVPHIQHAANQAKAEFISLAEPYLHTLQHQDILRGLILDRSLPAPLDELEGPLVILDGDLLFWESCEHWRFEGLLAGRLIPTQGCIVALPTGDERCVLWPRLHTSFWWIQDLDRLRWRIMDIRLSHLWDPFSPWQVPGPTGAPVWYHGDTGCNLYGAIREECTAFDSAHLDCYDHLFAGSTPVVMKVVTADPLPGYEWFPRIHAAAQRGDWPAIRGVWRDQEAFFYNRLADDSGALQPTPTEKPT